MYILFRRLCALGVFLSAAPAIAQSPPPEGWHLGLGAALISAPVSQGSDTRGVNLFPSISLGYQDRFSIDVRGARYTLRPRDTLEVTSVLSFSRGRKENSSDSIFTLAGGETDFLQGTGDIDSALGVGGTIRYSISDSLSLEAGLTQRVGPQPGLMAETGARSRGTIRTPGPPLFWSAGPSLTFIDDAYAQAFYGISAAQAARTSFTAYDVGAGLSAYKLSGSLIVPTTFTSAFILNAGWESLLGEYADSPVVENSTAATFTLIWSTRITL